MTAKHTRLVLLDCTPSFAGRAIQKQSHAFHCHFANCLCVLAIFQPSIPSSATSLTPSIPHLITSFCTSVSYSTTLHPIFNHLILYFHIQPLHLIFPSIFHSVLPYSTFIPILFQIQLHSVFPPSHIQPLIMYSTPLLHCIQELDSVFNQRQKAVRHVTRKLLLWQLSWYSHAINSLTPGTFEYDFKYVILKVILVIFGLGISCEIPLRWMSINLEPDQSRLVQVMAWCRQAASHYLSQSWPSSRSPYGIT